MLKKMKPAFMTGLGGTLGKGHQYLPWISREDLIEALIAPLKNHKMRGVYNAAAPQLITNSQFTKAFAETLKRPAYIPAPAFLLKLLPGEMAKNIFLCDLKLDSSKLLNSGFQFKHHDIVQCLKDLYKKT
jgi:NAD dependent epimerase/dehydratase family enzyme